MRRKRDRNHEKALRNDGRPALHSHQSIQDDPFTARIRRITEDRMQVLGIDFEALCSRSGLKDDRLKAILEDASNLEPSEVVALALGLDIEPPRLFAGPSPIHDAPESRDSGKSVRLLYRRVMSAAVAKEK